MGIFGRKSRSAAPAERAERVSNIRMSDTIVGEMYRNDEERYLEFYRECAKVHSAVLSEYDPGILNGGWTTYSVKADFHYKLSKALYDPVHDFVSYLLSRSAPIAPGYWNCAYGGWTASVPGAYNYWVNGHYLCVEYPSAQFGGKRGVLEQIVLHRVMDNLHGLRPLYESDERIFLKFFCGGIFEGAWLYTGNSVFSVVGGSFRRGEFIDALKGRANNASMVTLVTPIVGVFGRPDGFDIDEEMYARVQDLCYETNCCVMICDTADLRANHDWVWTTTSEWRSGMYDMAEMGGAGGDAPGSFRRSHMLSHVVYRDGLPDIRRTAWLQYVMTGGSVVMVHDGGSLDVFKRACLRMRDYKGWNIGYKGWNMSHVYAISVEDVASSLQWVLHSVRSDRIPAGPDSYKLF